MKRLEVMRGLIAARQNILPKRLVAPGPDAREVHELLAMAAAAPDHLQITPWRFVIVPEARRADLGEAFAHALADRDPQATAAQLDMAREKAQRAPFLMLAVGRRARVEGDGEIPTIERLVSLGAALQNVLLGAQAMGFGAGLTSGQALPSARLRRLFGLGEDEEAVCFLSVGTVAERRPLRLRPAVSSFTTTL